MVDVSGMQGGKLQKMSDEQLMIKEDTQFPPDVEIIYQIKNAYEGKYIPESGKETSGSGGGCFAATELMVNAIAREPKLVVAESDVGGEITDTMDLDVASIIWAWMKPNKYYARPKFRDLLASSAREALLSGFLCGERWFPDLEWDQVRDAYDNENTPDALCQNVLIRPSQNWIINRSHNTGLILPAPFWYKMDLSESYSETGFIGPLHLDQVVYGALHKRNLTDYYGMSPFYPCITEIINLGKAFQVAEMLGLHVIKPRPAATLQTGLGQTEIDLAYAAMDEYIQNYDAYENDTSLVIPGGYKIDYFFPKGMKFEDIGKYIERLCKLVFYWLGIPPTLLMTGVGGEGTRSGTEIHTDRFEQKMGQYRELIWSWWEDHFRNILRESGVQDWETTPIIIDWEAERQSLPSTNADESTKKEPISKVGGTNVMKGVEAGETMKMPARAQETEQEVL